MRILSTLLFAFLITTIAWAEKDVEMTITTINPAYRNTYLKGCKESCETITKRTKVSKNKRKEIINSCQQNCECSSNNLELFLDEEELFELVRSYDTETQQFANDPLKQKMNHLTQFCLSQPLKSTPTEETENPKADLIKLEPTPDTMGVQPNQ